MTEITAIRSGLRDRVRRQLAQRSGPPSLRAQVALLTSAFLLGGVLAALLFVGVWRHTAAEGDRARTAQLQSRQELQTTRTRLARSESELAAAQTALTKLRRDRQLLGREATTLRRVNTRAQRSLAPRLQGVSAGADRLGHQTAKLGSALATLRDYLRNASATGVDPAFLEAQVSYLIGSAGAARATAGAIAADAGRASTAAASLGKKR